MSNLTDEQLQGLQQKLTAERSRLRAEIRDELLRSDQEQYGELAGQVHDSGDESVADLLADINISIVGRLIQELRDVEAALERIREAAYGVCSVCGDDIPFERLEVAPAASRCLTHQEEYERTRAGGETPSM